MKIRSLSNKEICDKNGLKHPIYCNVVDEKKTKAKIRSTLKMLERMLCSTLGPYGSTTIIQDRERKHIITKDGYDLCNRIFMEDELSRTIVDIVRNVASNQVLTVGDGSTSAIVVASALYEQITNKKNYKKLQQVSSKDITSILKELAEILEPMMKELAIPLSDDLHELETIAKISTNNDAETGKFIYDLYSKIGAFGFITTDVVKKVYKDEYEIKNGIEWKRGAIDPCFFTGEKEDKLTLPEETAIFLSNMSFGKDDVKLLAAILGDYAAAKKKHVLIVGNDFSEDVRTFFKSNRLKHLGLDKQPELRFTVVDIDQVTSTSRNTLEDLAILLGVEVFDKFRHTIDDYYIKPERFISENIEKIIVTPKTTQIITSNNLTAEQSEFKENTIKELKEELQELLENQEEETAENDKKIYELRKRLSELTDSTAVIHVGGATLTERMSRERLIEDAIFASKSAIQHGYITGGNIVIPKIIHNNKRQIAKKLAEKFAYIPVSNVENFMVFFLTVVEDAFLESYRNVLSNSDLSEGNINKIIKRCISEDVFYNLKMHKWEKISETEVINSLQTDVQILNSAISIIGILAVSNQVIVMNFDME